MCSCFEYRTVNFNLGCVVFAIYIRRKHLANGRGLVIRTIRYISVESVPYLLGKEGNSSLLECENEALDLLLVCEVWCVGSDELLWLRSGAEKPPRTDD
ncbi:hypothetical protein G7K_5892-t1 [Saitoella complicata NRRL Y-17804]|uniref:Uncharacterized protein n=1 Tax=Saitoella complicata (strain BCRC 22490 / CBS 7301 / JCM 7358 / NBRC 10748 / NRRL Y-17804) TaxID=698492 RepID=A0A0E9NQ28_SAICN|nr:hypothetical protein G7K_5892-t1 [Saitoella complicata NRRL Y-17804]